jgi:predicted nucleotidyltransferase
MKTVVKMMFGSHLYGTDTPASDTDLKSVHIPDAKDILLQRVQDETVVGARDKAEGERNVSTDVDDKSYSLQKFLRLAAEGQTVAIDMLFAPQEMLEESSGWWRHIVSNRLKLLSRKSGSFVGYCRDQANKYGIKGSRVAAVREASEIFSSLLAQHGPMSKIGEHALVLEHLVTLHPEHTAIIEKLDRHNRPEKFFECCNRKVPFTASIKQAVNIYSAVFAEYGDRAMRAESNEGVDWKALSHAVRVGLEAVELLRTGHVTLPLTQADHLKDIKLGRLAYTGVAEEIEYLLELVEESAKTSRLPDEPDHAFIEQTIVNAYGNAIFREHLAPGNPWRMEVYGQRPMIDAELNHLERVA